jgi:hypothetical protein
MANINPSIVGEPYKRYVKDQIKVRQKVHASGLGGTDRTPEEITYLNSKNAWIKCASSVSIEDPTRLTDIGLNENLKGTELAKKFVLFNGISEYENPNNQRGGYNTGDDPNTENINELLLPGTLYGVGGLDFGQQPMPGILDFSLTHNDIGSIRFGQLKIRANNKIQFEILELLYIRLGYTIFLEWGNNMYFENPERKGTVEAGPGAFGGPFDQGGFVDIDDVDENDLQVTDSPENTSSPGLKYTGVDTVTLIDDGTWFEPPAELLTHLGFFQKIEEKRKEFHGNYDAFFGRVVNFDWTFNPSGYYEIDLVLRDLGDVVESFKVNALTKKNTVPNLTDSGVFQSEANQNDVRNYLYCLRTTFEEESTPFNTEDNNSDFVNLNELTSIAAGTNNKGTREALRRIPSNTDHQYIRFGTFLDWVENNIIPHITNQGQQFPMVSISTTDANYMRMFEGLVSTNPKFCVIKNDFLGEFNNEKIGDNEVNNKLFSKFKSINVNNDPYTGKIMNIYLEISELEDTFRQALGQSPTVDVDLLTLLNVILQRINKCFGGYIDLKVGIQEGNVLVIRDTKLESRVDSEGKRFEKQEEDKEGIIKVFGYDPDNLESNFVRNFKFNTRISNRLASQISIGAASNRTNTTNISGFFENLNIGLKDRFQEKTSDNNLEEETEEFISNCKAGEAQKEIKPNPNFVTTTGYNTNDAKYRFQSTPAKKEEEKKDQNDIEIATENLSEAIAVYFQLLSFAFGTTTSEEQSVIYYRYFQDDEKLEVRGERLSSALQKYLGASKVFLEKKTGSSLASSTLGFIPIDISLTLDGISGIKIYNQLSIDAKFLPKPYPEVVDFVVMNVAHRVANNSWETEIRAISKPNISKSDIQAVDELLEQKQREQQGPQLGPEEEPIADETQDLTYYPPLGSLSFDIRNDDQGAGAFGASRKSGTKTHNGIDLRTQIPNTPDIDLLNTYPYLKPRRIAAFANIVQTGTVAPTTNIPDAPIISGRGNAIYAPITGILSPTSADSVDSILPGIRINGIGKYKGIRVLILYAAPRTSLYGSVVKKGDYIGNAINIQLQPKYSNVTNHIHFEIIVNNKAVDPQQQTFDLNKESAPFSF